MIPGVVCADVPGYILEDEHLKLSSFLPRRTAFVIAVAFAFCGVLRAQYAIQSPEDAVKTLSPDAQKVIARLGELGNLPSGAWRYHEGDIAHGESTSLDDSSWPAVKPPSDSSTEAVWYRQWIEVPKTLSGYDLTGARIWFQFRAEANGPMPEII